MLTLFSAGSPRGCRFFQPVKTHPMHDARQTRISSPREIPFNRPTPPSDAPAPRREHLIELRRFGPRPQGSSFYSTLVRYLRRGPIQSLRSLQYTLRAATQVVLSSVDSGVQAPSCAQ
jgi:hypothetical protein